MSTSLGLLKKANLLAQTRGLAFCEFIDKFNISAIAKFSLIDNYFYITNSYNFDIQSIMASKSSLDFWNGIAAIKNTLYSFTHKEKSITSLLQFFSFKLKDSIEKIQIVRENESIYMICNSNFDQKDISHLITVNDNLPKVTCNLDKISKNSFINKIHINLEKCIDNYLSNQNLNSQIKNIFTNSIDNEISNQLYFNFSNNNFFCKNSKLDFSLALNSLQDLDERIIKQHLFNNLNQIIENTSNIVIDFLGKSENYSDLANFLKVE